MASRSTKKSQQKRAQGRADVEPAPRDTDLTFDLTKLPPPEHTLAVDCGLVRKRQDSGEVLFAQLNPFDDGEIQRLLVVRFSMMRFVDRAVQNKSFIVNIESAARQAEMLGELGASGKRLESAKPCSDCTFSMIDAEAEQASFSAGRGGIVFFTAPAYEMHMALSGKSRHIEFRAAIEVTMPIRVLADVYLMWSRVAGVQS